jgi:hypothetical protein
MPPDSVSRPVLAAPVDDDPEKTEEDVRPQPTSTATSGTTASTSARAPRHRGTYERPSPHTCHLVSIPSEPESYPYSLNVKRIFDGGKIVTALVTTYLFETEWLVSTAPHLLVRVRVSVSVSCISR